jgi:methionine-rich copper-binding protein CopC
MTMKPTVLMAALLSVSSTTTAFAHAFLDHVVPAVGSTVATAPAQVLLFFTQDLEPAFSGATIADANGRPVTSGPAVFDPRNKMEMVLNPPMLAPGHYTASWHALSVDTHRTEGSFGFDVRR